MIELFSHQKVFLIRRAEDCQKLKHHEDEHLGEKWRFSPLFQLTPIREGLKTKFLGPSPKQRTAPNHHITLRLLNINY